MNKKHITLALVIAAVTIAIFYLERDKPKRASSGSNSISLKETQESAAKALKAIKYDTAKEISTPDGFINTDGKPITMQELIGKKVILVDFWTYSCINCQRTIPYLNAWYDKYKDQGLEIIGMHTPEFGFEQKYDNVAAAVKKFGIKYPVVLDNDFSTWQDYQNQYWPRKYLIDIDGFIVYDHIGEGGYDETEKKIQDLLAERMTTLGMQGTVASDIVKPADAVSVDQTKPLSPETYFGAMRNEYLANGKPLTLGELSFAVPSEIKANLLYLGGKWNISNEYAESGSTSPSVTYRYRAKDLYFVGSANAPVKVKILRDGKPLPADLAGEDVKMEGSDAVMYISEDRLYKVIKENAWGEHTLQMIIEGPGLKAYTFTFG